VKVALVTTFGTACGIASHSALLKTYVELADPAIEVLPWTDLHPQSVKSPMMADLIWLNFQAGLLSQWTPDWIRRWQAVGMRVGVTYHDTGVPNSEQCKAIIDACDAAVVHEPFDDLPAEKTHYWRMGVPELHGWHGLRGPYFADRPMLGTVGHDLPWKNWGELAQITRAVGWGLVICTPAMTDERLAELKALTPWLHVHVGLEADLMLATLHECDATAALYVCHNTGQSGAVLQCIGAKKPVFAFTTCRQFRALFGDPLAQSAIRWATSYEAVQRSLRCLPIQRLDAGIVALAEQESWTHLGQKYAHLYSSLVA
jgi:hypothetical protein